MMQKWTGEMQADFPVILDACVLAPPRLCDFLLRLAEFPRLYLPKWTDEILEEVKRTQMNKLKPPFPVDLADYWNKEVTASFPEAMISGYNHLISHMGNEEKDRHVLAAAVHDKVSTIITFNMQDFKSEHLATWNISAQHPQDFLMSLYSINSNAVIGKLTIMAQDISSDVQSVLKQLGKQVPLFTNRVLEDMGLSDVK